MGTKNFNGLKKIKWVPNENDPEADRLRGTRLEQGRWEILRTGDDQEIEVLQMRLSQQHWFLFTTL